MFWLIYSNYNLLRVKSNYFDKTVFILGNIIGGFQKETIESLHILLIGTAGFNHAAQQY